MHTLLKSFHSSDVKVNVVQCERTI